MSSPICAAASLPTSRALLVLAWSVGVCGTALLLLGGGAATAAIDPRCPVGLTAPQCADLDPGSLTPTVIEDGRRLQLTVAVANNGTADAPASTLQVTIGEEVLPAEPLPAVAVKDQVQLTLTEEIPPDLRGTGQRIRLTVDPANDVPELEESNNDSVTKVFLPALPDLVIESPELHVVNGNAVVVDAVVANRGSADDAVPTTLTVAANGLSKTTPVRALVKGESSPVQATLPVPERARVGAITVTLTVDQPDVVAEADETNNAVTPDPVTIAPELAITAVGRTLNSKTVTLDVSVQNVGNTGAAATQVNASAPGWQSMSVGLTALAAGASTHVPVSLMVPRSAQGGSVDVTVEVVRVPGDSADGNTRGVQVQIPRPPAITRPDLAVSGLRLRLAGDNVLAHAAVANIGDARSGSIRLELVAPGWPTSRDTLDALAPGATIPVDFVVRVPDDARGNTAPFELRADPAPRERNLANNETSAGVTLPAPPPTPPNHRSRLVPLIAIGGVLLALCAAVGFTLRGRRLRVRARWQNGANGERPDTCKVPQTHVLRGECKLKPAFRKVEKLELATRDEDGNERRKSLDGELVDKLNRALWWHRFRRHRRVRALVEPLGERLAAEIEQWLAAQERADIAISAEIKGGKLECEFKRSECVRDGDACRWEEREEWKAEVEHTVEEPVADVHVPFEPRAERIRQLSAELVALIGRVDVPRRVRAPEAIPLPRDR